MTLKGHIIFNWINDSILFWIELIFKIVQLNGFSVFWTIKIKVLYPILIILSLIIK